MRYAGIALAGALALGMVLLVWDRAGQAGEQPPAWTVVVPGIASDGGTGCGPTLPEDCPVPTVRLVVHGSADPDDAPGGSERDRSGEALTVEIASTPETRRQGLMFRQSLPEFAGMLFVFPREVGGGFWMKNTPLPLDIAYLAADGTVLEIVHGVPFSLDILSPSQPYRYTLEVNGGWFERHGFGPGDRVELPQGLTAQ